MVNQSFCTSYVFQLLVIYCAGYLIFTSCYFILIKLRYVMHGIGTIGFNQNLNLAIINIGLH